MSVHFRTPGSRHRQGRLQGWPLLRQRHDPRVPDALAQRRPPLPTVILVMSSVSLGLDERWIMPDPLESLSFFF